MSTNVCVDQKTFNDAFYKALEHSRNKDSGMSGGVVLYVFIHLFALFLGIMLAVKYQPPKTRLLHITLAIVFGPAYCIAYYINTGIK